MAVWGTPERVTLWETGGASACSCAGQGVGGEGAITGGGMRGQLGHSPRFHKGLSCSISCRSRNQKKATRRPPSTDGHAATFGRSLIVVYSLIENGS